MRRLIAAALAAFLALSAALPAEAQALSARKRLLLLAPPAAATPSGAAFSATDIDPNGHISLDATRLIPTADGSGTYGSVRTTTSHASGKYCFQWTSTTSAWQIGIVNGTDALTTDIASKASAYAWYAAFSGQVYHNGSATGLPAVTSGSTFSSGATGRACFDFTNHLGWFWYSGNTTWNNDVSADPATGLGGFTIASDTFFGVFSGGSADTATFNFATPTLPSGFSAW